MSTLTSKGQITIPLPVRRALGLETGDRIEFLETGKGQFTIIPANKSVRSLKGSIPKLSKPVSIKSMNATIAKRASGVR
jgi:hypothetical protein